MILQLLSILLLVGMAEAEPIKVEQVQVQLLDKTEDGCVEYRKGGELPTTTCQPAPSCEPNPKMWYIDPQLGVMWTSPCEQKMKEAMRLISPYIDYGTQITFREALYRSPQTKLREEADRLDRRDAALRKWEAIYKECVE